MKLPAETLSKAQLRYDICQNEGVDAGMQGERGLGLGRREEGIFAVGASSECGWDVPFFGVCVGRRGV